MKNMGNNLMQKKDQKNTQYNFINTGNLKKKLLSKPFEKVVIELFLKNRKCA